MQAKAIFRSPTQQPIPRTKGAGVSGNTLPSPDWGATWPGTLLRPPAVLQCPRMSLNEEAWSLLERLAVGDTDHKTLVTLAQELLERRAYTEALVERKAEEALT